VQLIDETIDHAGTVLLSGSGELGVTPGGGGAGVAEQHLDMAQT
jgi:hypothetical protein